MNTSLLDRTSGVQRLWPSVRKTLHFMDEETDLERRNGLLEVGK